MIWKISESFYDDGVNYITLDGPIGSIDIIGDGSDAILAHLVQALNAYKVVEEPDSETRTEYQALPAQS